MAVWRLITHHEYPQDALNWYLQHRIIALGWGETGDLQNLDAANQYDIAEVIGIAYPGIKNKGAGGRCLWDFWQEMDVDDLVILRSNSVNHRVARVTGNYFFDDTYPPGININNRLDGYCYRRQIELTREDPDRLWKQTRLAPNNNLCFALCHLVYK